MSDCVLNENNNNNVIIILLLLLLALELDRLHIYPIILIAPIVRTANGEADCDCCLFSKYIEVPCL